MVRTTHIADDGGLALPGINAASQSRLWRALEGRTLQDELESYKEYARKVKHRLIPYIW